MDSQSKPSKLSIASICLLFLLWLLQLLGQNLFEFQPETYEKITEAIGNKTLLNITLILLAGTIALVIYLFQLLGSINKNTDQPAIQTPSQTQETEKELDKIRAQKLRLLTADEKTLIRAVMKNDKRFFHFDPSRPEAAGLSSQQIISFVRWEDGKGLYQVSNWAWRMLKDSKLLD